MVGLEYARRATSRNQSPLSYGVHFIPTVFCLKTFWNIWDNCWYSWQRNVVNWRTHLLFPNIFCMYALAKFLQRMAFASDVRKKCGYKGQSCDIKIRISTKRQRDGEECYLLFASRHVFRLHSVRFRIIEVLPGRLSQRFLNKNFMSNIR